MTIGEKSLKFHRKLRGKIAVFPKAATVAIVSDGSAVLGLGNLGPEGAIPVMEGKAIIFKEFAGIDAVPIVLKTQEVDEIVRTVENISPIFGGINLEDIAAPRCFEIEERLKKLLDIPVMHDDQHGTAIVVLAGLIKKELARITNKRKIEGDIARAVSRCDAVIGVSQAGILKPEHIKLMAEKPIVFAMANPVPEIMPDAAKGAGAFIVATGRSDFSNQINNALVFPGIFRGALDNGVKRITDKMKIKAAEKLASIVKRPTPNKIIPPIFDKRVVKAIASVIK